ncbi:MAG: ion transporter [Lachnospiraceae bacterium]|nr:ion transporter [Lachnospiraceae bacterium]
MEQKVRKLVLFKKRLYEIVEAGTTEDPASLSYDIMMFIAVVVGMIPLMTRSSNCYTLVVDLLTLSLFVFDYAVRIFTSDYKMGVVSYKAYLYYAFTPMAIVDLLSITPVLSFVFPDSTLVSLFRVFRVLRVLKLVRYSKTMVTITNVLKKVRKQLTAVLILVVVYIIATALIIFQVEPELFDTFFEAVYWAAVSITTIGYGDISPVSSWGRVITIVSALVGMAIIALPSGIITAAYMEEITKKKGKHEL